MNKLLSFLSILSNIKLVKSNENVFLIDFEIKIWFVFENNFSIKKVND